jgi:Fe-S oxidoreductase
LLYNDEKCSPRGRIVFLTEILKGRINIEHVDPETINKISKTCFNCKLCSEECFDNLNVTKVNRAINQIQGYEKLKDLTDDLDEKLLMRLM